MPAADRSSDRRGRDQRVPLALAAASALLLLTGSSAAPVTDEPVIPVSSTLPRVEQVDPTTAPSAAGDVLRRDRSGPVVPVRSAGLPAVRPPSDTTVPARLRVRDVAIDVPVHAVGVDRDGQMAMLDTVGAAGWYEYGSRPADRVGTTVVAGHVDTRTEGLGPFASLAALRTGARIEVADRAGRTSVYRVTDLTRIGKHDADLAQVFDRTGRPRLQIITCAGAYDPRTGYHDYLIVTAVPI